MRALLASGLLFVFTASAIAEESPVTPGFLLLPGPDEIVAPSTGYSFSYNRDGGSAGFDIFAPLKQTRDGWLLYDLGLAGNYDGGFDMQSFAGHAGLVYRRRIDENRILGFNAYLEGGESATNEFMGQASLGFEYETRNPDLNRFFQAGGNYYIPFDDYTNRAKYGEVGAAPRQGLDAYLSYGQGFDGYALRGSLTAFDYVETDDALGLSGYRGDIEVEWKRGLPEGMVASFGLGFRDDNRAGVDPAVEANVGLRWAFGGGGGGRPTTEDCAVVRDGDGSTTVDCGEMVLANPSGVIVTKDGQVLPDDLVSKRAVMLNPPRRNLAFGGQDVPIEYKSGAATLRLVKQSGGTDGSFSFTSTAPGLPMAMTTVGGSATSPIVEVLPGTYVISETALPDGWSLTSATCTGATATAATATGVEVTLEGGDAAVCTFVNGFEPDPRLTVTSSGVSVVSTSRVNQVVVRKAIVGDDAPAASFTFSGNVPGLPVTVSGTGGAQVLAVGSFTVAPGSYSLDEINLPENFALSDIDCAILGTVFDCTFTNTYTAPPPTTGTIQLDKVVTGDPAPQGTTFAFAGPAGLAGTRDLASLTGTAVELEAGSYTITETDIPAGFLLDSATCTGATFATVEGGVQVTLAAEDAAVCTFTNSYVAPPPPSGSIQLVKMVTAEGAPAADFSFTGSDPALTATLSGTGGIEAIDGPAAALAPGVYTITESAIPANFSLDTATCEGATFTAVTNGVEVTLADGDEAICVFENGYTAPTGSIQVDKVVLGDTAPAAEFVFDGSDAALDATLAGAGGAEAIPGTPVTLVPGVYTITEAALGEGWTLDAATCSGATFAAVEGGVEVTLAATEAAVCTFTNSYLTPTGSIQVDKVVLGDTAPAAEFVFDGSDAALDATLAGAGGAEAIPGTPVTLVPGVYTITEAALGEGWTLDAATCSGATFAAVEGGVEVTLAATEAAVCTFTNSYLTPTGSIQVDKVVLGDTAPAADFVFDGSDAALDATLAGAGGAETLAGTPVTLVPGVYTITEAALGEGWTLDAATCSGATFAAVEGGVEVTLAATEAAVCTFTNSYLTPTGSIQVDKVVLGDTAPAADFVFDGSDAALDATLAGAGGAETLTGTPVTLAAGTVYTISETNIPANFALTDLACTGGASVATNLGAGSATITLAANETVICTFTNSYTPPPETIQIVKQTVRAPYVPEDVVIPAADHSFFGLPSDISLSVPEGGATVMSDPIEVAPGVFDLSESGAEGFVTVGVTCTGTTTVTPATVDDPYIRIDLADGEAAVCTFVNEYRPPSGTVTITKIVRNPNGLDVPATDFTMDGSVAALDVVLSGLGGTATQQTVVGQPITVPVGDYTLGETALADGFYLLGLTCSGNGSGGLLPSVTLTVSEGANTDCFVNNRYAPGDGPTVTLNKTTSVGDGEFEFVTQAYYDDGSSGFFTETVTTTNGSGQLTFNLPAGVEAICVQEGGGVIYDLNGNVVNVPFSNAYTNVIDVNGVPFEPDGSSCAGFGALISVENDLLIDWVNYPENQSARLILNKVATAADGVTIPAATITFEELDATVTSNPHLLDFGTQSVTTPDGGGPVFNAVFSILDVGSYTIGETDLPEGWDLTDISCDGGSPVYDLDANTFSVDLVPEDLVTCTVTNTFTPPPTELTITKVVPDFVPGQLIATFGLTSDNADVNGQTLAIDASDPAVDTITVTVPAGTLLIEEDMAVLAATNQTFADDAATERFAYDSLVCDGGVATDTANGVSLTLAGEPAVTCTLTNVIPPAMFEVTKYLNCVDYHGNQLDCPAATFDFNANGAVDYTQSITIGAGPAPIDGVAATPIEIVPGTYSVSELQDGADLPFLALDPMGFPIGWSQGGASLGFVCEVLDSQGGVLSDVEGFDSLLPAIAVPSGSTLSCSWPNTYVEPPPPASFTLVKHAVNYMQADSQIAPPTSFSFTASQSVANATLDVPEVEPYGNEAFVVGPTVSIQPGTFSITENVPANWSMNGGSFSGSTWYCLDYPDTATLDPATGFPSETGGEFFTSDGNPALSFTAEAGKNYVCNAENIYTPPAKIIIEKSMAPRYAVNFEYVIDPDTGETGVGLVPYDTLGSAGECRVSQVEIAGDISATIAVTYDPATQYCFGTYEVEVPANAAYSFHEVNFGPSPAIVAADPFGAGATGSPYATCLDPITRPYIDCGNFDTVVAGNHVDNDGTEGYTLYFGVGEVYCSSNFQSPSGQNGAVTTGVMQSGEILTCSVSNDGAAAASDRRLKQNIEPLGVTANGHTLYAFDYLPGMGLPAGRFVGVMAQDLIGTADAGAVLTMANGYYAVRYGQLGLRMVSWETWQKGGLDAVTAPMAAALRP